MDRELLNLQERRRSPRRAPGSDETLAAVRLRAGATLAVVDIADTGALVEGPSRLLPGTHVETHVVTGDGRTLIRSRVVRAAIVKLTADTVRYRAALAFDRHVNTAPSRVVATQRSSPVGSSGNGNRDHPTDAVAAPHEEGTC